MYIKIEKDENNTFDSISYALEYLAVIASLSIYYFKLERIKHFISVFLGIYVFALPILCLGFVFLEYYISRVLFYIGLLFPIFDHLVYHIYFWIKYPEASADEKKP